MSTSKTYQQSLVDVGSETRPLMLERGSTIPRLQEVDDLQGDDLLYYDAEMELMNMILLSIPNKIYNSVDSCKTAKEMWARVERLMRGTIQNQVDRETRFTNEFDQFVAEPLDRGDVASAMVIMESLNEFQHVSGLIPSIPKSTAFFGNVVNHVKVGILSIMPFSEGELPIKYLGVLLILSRLLNKDCKILVEKARNRIGDWKNKSLSFAGRLQLCKPVISSMQVYWASILVIPKGITSDIQQLTCGFLWCNGDYKRGKVKVAWESICLPKSEGGHGLRSLEGWRKILQLREQVRPFIWVVIGNWHKTSLWHDHWCTQSLLSHHLSLRDTARDGYNLRTCVSDLVVHGGWNWHSTWLAKAPILVSIPTPVLDYTSQDCMKRQDTNGNFSSRAWEALRPSSNEVSWFEAAYYYVWLERNNRLFKSIRRQPEELCELIIVTVRLKLLTFKFKNTAKVESLLSL
ncbi:hypothetical protein Tco_0877816 [Tanacetum coccineum]|uniref:Uncharacterized protein n=1 Tax=Tanacetum coccineum TaxID=301880 RepID=A0ABQ5BW44_9ASTR